MNISKSIRIDFDSWEKNNPLVLLGHLTYIILLILAGIYYLERVIYSDAAFYTFKMIYFNSFNIEFGRYTAVLYEWPSYLAIKLGLPLKTIVQLLSINVIAVSYLAYNLSVFYFKNFAGAFTILMLNINGIASSFFYPISESYIGLIFCVILYLWLEKRKNRTFDLITILVGFAIIFAGFLSHPAVSIVIAFVLIYHALNRSGWRYINLYVIFTFFLIIFFWKSFQIQNNSYESGIISHLKDYKSIFKDFFQLRSVRYYFYAHFKIYYLNHLILIITAIYLIRKKNFLILSYYLLAYLGVLLFYIVLYNKGESTVMMEKAFLPITVFLFLPFFDYVVFSSDKYKFIKMLFLSSVIILGLLRFISVGRWYSERIQFIDNIISNASSPKTVKYQDEEFNKHAEISWALGVETLLYSSIKDSNNSKTVYFIDKQTKLDSAYISSPNTFLCVTFWPYWDATKLDPRYFNLPAVQYELPEDYLKDSTSQP